MPSPYTLPNKKFTIGVIAPSDNARDLTLTTLSDSTALVAGDVNRFLVTRETGKKNHFRRITAIDVTNQIVTLDLPFSVRLFPDQDVQDVSVGDELALSHSMVDVIADNTGIVLSNSVEVNVDSLVTSGGAYIDANYYRITWASEDINISQNSGLILGVPIPKNQSGLIYPSIRGFCDVLDTSSGTGNNNLAGGGNNKGTDFGMFAKFGGSYITADEDSALFLRTYNDPLESRVIFYRGAFGGGFSARIDGNYYYVDMRAAGMIGNIGPISGKTATNGVIKLGVTASDQFYYAHADLGPEAVVEITSATDMNESSRVSRFSLDTSKTLGLSRLEYVITKTNFDEPDNAIQITNANGKTVAKVGSHIQRLCCKLNPVFVGADGVALTDTIYSVFKEASGKKLIEYDGTEDATVDSVELTDGKYPTVRMRWADIKTYVSGQSSTTVKSYDHADATRYQEVVGYTKGYGYLTVRSVIDPENHFQSDVRVDVDTNIAETDQTVVDAYTEIDTAEKLYDSYSSWRCSVDTIEIEDELKRVGSLIESPDIDMKLATDYDATALYAVGAVVYEDSKIYECDTAITTAEVFDATKWTEKVAGVFGVELLANADADISSTIDTFYLYYGTDSFTGSVDLGSGTLTIEEVSAITGTIAEQSLVRVNINVPTNTTLKGKHESGADVFTDIAYEDLGTNTFKSILVAPDAEVKLAFCVRGSNPRYFLYDSANGITITPEFTAYTNPIGDDEDWIDDFTLSYASDSLDVVCDDLSNVAGNNLSGSDMTLFLYKIHRSEAYLDLLLDKEADGFITDTANSVFNVIEVDSFALDMELSLDDTLAENLEISFSYLYPTGSSVTTPKNANAVASKVDLFKRNEVSTWDQDANQAQISAQTAIVRGYLDDTDAELEELKHTNNLQSVQLAIISKEAEEIAHAVASSLRQTIQVRAAVDPNDVTEAIHGYKKDTSGADDPSNGYGEIDQGTGLISIFDAEHELEQITFEHSANVNNFSISFADALTAADRTDIEAAGNAIFLANDHGQTHKLLLSDGDFEVLAKKQYTWSGLPLAFSNIPTDFFENAVRVQFLNAEANTALKQTVANKTAIDLIENTDLTATNAKIDAVKVVVDSNDTKLDANKTAIDDIKTEVDALENTDFTDTHTKIDDIKTVVDSNDTKLDANKTAVDGVKTVVDSNDTKLDTNKSELGKIKKNTNLIPATL